MGHCDGSRCLASGLKRSGSTRYEIRDEVWRLSSRLAVPRAITVAPRVVGAVDEGDQQQHHARALLARLPLCHFLACTRRLCRFGRHGCRDASGYDEAPHWLGLGVWELSRWSELVFVHRALNWWFCNFVSGRHHVGAVRNN